MKKKLSTLIALVMAISLCLMPVAAMAVVSPAPVMQEISPLSVVTDASYNTLTGQVDLVFDFESGIPLLELEMDIGPDPYGGINREQVGFLAIEGEGVTGTPEELELMAQFGVVPIYDATEQKWTISIDTTAVQTQALLDLLGEDCPFPWAANAGDPIYPDGLFHWYLEVEDVDSNVWGDMYTTPDYAHYVCYFDSTAAATVLVETEVVEDIIQISINPTSFDFGQLRQGECSVPQPVVITSTSNMDIVVSTSTISPFYTESLSISVGEAWGPVNSWSDSIAKGGTLDTNLKVCVPDPWDAGVQTGTIIFWAEEAVTP